MLSTVLTVILKGGRQAPLGVELLYYGVWGRSATDDHFMAGQEGFESPAEMSDFFLRTGGNYTGV